MLGDGLGRDDDSPHRIRRFCNGLEHPLVKELGVSKEERCVPTKQHEAGNATRIRIALDVVIAPNTIDSPEHRVVWPPAVPQELDDRDDDGDADARNHAENRNTDEADNGQPELPWLDTEDATQVCKFEQADGRGDHDRSERAAGQILQQVGCEYQKQRDRDGAHDSGELRLRAGRFGDRCA